MRYLCQYTLIIVWRQQYIPVIDIDDVCEAATSYIERGRERDPIQSNQSIMINRLIARPIFLLIDPPVTHIPTDLNSLKPIRP